MNLREQISNTQDLDVLCQTPAAALGSCRFKLKNIKEDSSQFEEIIRIFRKHEIAYFIYAGGNDSMDTVDKLSAYCKEQGITDISVMGAPKTIDNDLVGTDHCPGFGSAAKYIGTTFAELERDCHVYDTKAVTIVEVMGRNAGWLTAASALARNNGGPGPNLIYLCEPEFSVEGFLRDVKKELESHDSVLVAISEEIKDANGVYVSEQVQSGAVDTFGHTYVQEAPGFWRMRCVLGFGCKVRSIELNLMQRCASHIASAVDIQESRMLGMTACQMALEGKSGLMAAVERVSDAPYEVRFVGVPVSQVSNRKRKFPEILLTKREMM